jgi:hypothetical protein
MASKKIITNKHEIIQEGIKEPESADRQARKRILKELVDLKTQVAQKKIKAADVLNQGYDGETYLKVSKFYEIIDNLIVNERKQLKPHLKSLINQKLLLLMTS